jgi:hypothetical protein
MVKMRLWLEYEGKKIAADAMAVLALAVQCSLVTVVVQKLFPGRFPTAIAIGLFPVFAGVAVAILHAKERKMTVAMWGWLAVLSPFAGIGFLGIDWALALANGGSNPAQSPGSLLGLPLTILVCPVGTMVLVAGFVRALSLRRLEATSSRQQNFVETAKMR